MTDFSVVGNGPDFKILTTHTTSRDDSTPLQLVSGARMAQLLAKEALAATPSGDPRLAACSEPIPSAAGAVPVHE